MCNGNPAIFLYRDGEEIGWLTNHHARLLRSSLWKSDAKITDVEAFLTWFDNRKILQPRDEFQAGLKRERESEAAYEKWVAAMPVSLQPHWEAASRSALDPDLDALRPALEMEFPEKNDRILALFGWFGSGTGKWSGYPVYETVAEVMLLDYSTSDLLAAVKERSLTASQIEGVARLFAGWNFSQQRPVDVDQLPSRLKEELLQHCETSDDEDKLSRVRNAFGKC